jgi:hypothetical protein
MAGGGQIDPNGHLNGYLGQKPGLLAMWSDWLIEDALGSADCILGRDGSAPWWHCTMGRE